jgi:hypothetical protein
MLNYIRNLFSKKKVRTKAKPIQQQLLELSLGSFVVFHLNHDICNQHISKGIDRFDLAILHNKQLKGLVKAVYTSDVGHVYVEVLGLVVAGDHATRKEYVLMWGEIEKLAVISV